MSPTPEARTATARRRPRRSLTLRVLGVWLLLVATVLGTGTAASSTMPSDTSSTADRAATATARPSLAGTWDLTVVIHTPDGGIDVATPRFIFHPDHTLSAAASDEPGNPVDETTGFWKEKRNGTFSFYVMHPGGDDGPYAETVQAVHLGRVTRSGFATSAHAFVTPENGGAPLGPITVRSVAERVRP
ncbi:hypothetical protein [Streptomyces apocyni]|uniref:hypothetical protein n=1 Tax=Streptomyces apocyni TaxID=2654677 RepID=UPI0012EA0E6F|nr:hypothetical protein [Streptomyces apocyni]